MARHSLIAAVVLLMAATAHAQTHVWEMSCSEDQVSNSGVGDGSTDSAATGAATLRYDTATERVYHDVSYDGLEGLLSNIHIHGPAALGASNPNHVFDIFSDVQEVLDAGVDRTTDRVVGTDELLDLILGSNGVGLGTLEENAQVMIDDLAYVNIHTDLWPMGEIRCQFVTTAVLSGQTKDQQKCTNAMLKGLGKVASTRGRSLCKCVKDFSRGKLAGLLEDCVAAGDDKLVKAQAKVTEAFTKRCSGNDKDAMPRLPTFGVTDDATVNMWGALLEFGLARGMFGPDFDAAIDDGTDAARGKCQSAALKAAKKCEDTRVKEYGKCVKGELKGKVGLTIVDEFGLEQCLSDDSKGKIAAACDADSGKVRATLDSQCAGVDLTSAFPDCAAADAAATAACVDRVSRCALCIVNNLTTGTAVDCELHDDGADNGSCTPPP